MKRMFQSFTVLAAVLAAAGVVGAQGAKPLKKCPSDSVVAGTVCMDKYEASVWRTGDPKLIRKIQKGKATVADLIADGWVQLGTTTDNYAPCSDDAQTCAGDIFALSLPGVTPSRYLTWFQAQEACANSLKRLPTNAEWQVAANQTPDGGSCNVASGTVAPTGSSGCISARGAEDMVGNLWEWVVDWVPRPTACPGWGGFSDDFMCLSGASTTALGPGALLRGGDCFGLASSAGPLAVFVYEPSNSYSYVGFRCAR